MCQRDNIKKIDRKRERQRQRKSENYKLHINERITYDRIIIALGARTREL